MCYEGHPLSLANGKVLDMGESIAQKQFIFLKCIVFPVNCFWLLHDRKNTIIRVAAVAAGGHVKVPYLSLRSCIYSDFIGRHEQCY